MNSHGFSVENGITALHVAADALACTAIDAEGQVARLEASTSYGGDGRTRLALADLTSETIGPLKADGSKAIKFYLRVDEQPPDGRPSTGIAS